MFHWRNNLFFGRRKDGGVRIVRCPDTFNTSTNWPDPDIAVEGADIDLVIPANEWVSIVASVAERDGVEIGAAYESSKKLHGATTF